MKYALMGKGSPSNVLNRPTINTDYSSLRDINLEAWIQEALDNGYRFRVIEEFQIL
jgi:hypothetical protein